MFNNDINWKRGRDHQMEKKVEWRMVWSSNTIAVVVHALDYVFGSDRFLDDHEDYVNDYDYDYDDDGNDDEDDDGYRGRKNEPIIFPNNITVELLSLTGLV